MNKFKIEKIKALQDEIFKLQNENIDPLFNIRKQIENKEYKLRKMRYIRYPIICGLTLNTNRIRTLIANIHFLVQSKDFSTDFKEYKNGNTWNHKKDTTNNHYIKELYKIWVKL
jgi:hypothetical protein